MKKLTAAMLLLVLCACGVTEQQTPAEKGSAALQSEVQLEQLSDYVEPGTNLVDALEGQHKNSAIVPFAVGESYAIADSQGIPITDAVYDTVELIEADDQLFWVLQEGKRVTCVSQKGELVIERKKGSVTVLQEQYIALEKANGRCEILRSDGTTAAKLDGQVYSCESDTIVWRDEQKHWYLTDANTWKTIPVEGVRRIGRFSGNYATVKLTKTSWGVVDRSGVVTPIPDAAWLSNVRGGYLLGRDLSGACGVWSAKGKEAVPFDYRKGKPCSDTLPLYQLWDEDGDCVVKNVATGQKMRVPRSFDGQELTVWPDLYYSFVQEDGTVVLFDDLGTLELPAQAELFALGEDTVGVCDGKTYSLIHLSEGEQTREWDGNLLPVQEINYKEQLFVVENTEGKQGICNRNGKLVIDPEYDWIRATADNWFAVRQDGVCGLIDESGEWIIQLRES